MQVSIVNYSEIKAFDEFRFDSEFYTPLAIENDGMIRKYSFSTMRDIGCKIVSGPFGSTLTSDAYISEGIPFVRIRDLQNFFITKDSLVFISQEDNERIQSSQLSIGDLVLSKVGNTIGVVSKVTSCIGNCNISENNIGIKFNKRISDLEKDYILTFLNSKKGQIQILRRISGNAQPKLNVSDIYSILIPDISNCLKNRISSLVNFAYSCVTESKTYYIQAEQILLSELGLAGWQPKHRLSFVKSYSDTQEAERIDAEYFQPKYDEIINAVKKYKGGWDILDNLVKISKSIEPGSNEYREEGIKFVRVSNLSKFGIDDSNQQYISEDLYEQLKNHQPRQGEVLLSKDATPGIAYHLRSELEKMIPSGGILRLKLKDSQVNEDYLTLVLNSLIVKEQINRDVGGSVILHWRPDQVKQTILPILSDANQQKIQQKITESFNLRKKSKHLLECAKKAVEMAVEKNEKTAVNWMKQQAEKLKI